MWYYKFGLAIIIALILFGCGSNSSESTAKSSSVDTIGQAVPTSVAVAEITLRSTVSITMQDRNRQTLAIGSGVLLDSGKVITNLHVISNATYGYVVSDDNMQKHPIEGQLAIDEINDLAILSVPTLSSTSIKLNSSSPRVGEQIFVTGNPQGFAGTFSEGLISSLRVFEGRELIQITAPTSPGSSGGAVVNGRAELIGITIGGFTGGQNLNFAIPIKYAEKLLDGEHILSHLNYKTNRRKRSTGPSQNLETDLLELVQIRNIRWSHDELITRGFNSSFFLQGPNHLQELSILNTTSCPISNIKIFIVIYDRSGTPVDYSELEVLPNGTDVILPGLAKTFSPFGLKLDKKLGYSYDVRLLDYTLHYDH